VSAEYVVITTERQQNTHKTHRSFYAEAQNFVEVPFRSELKVRNWRKKEKTWEACGLRRPPGKEGSAFDGEQTTILRPTMQRLGASWLLILAIACLDISPTEAQADWRCPNFALLPGLMPNPLIESAPGCVARYTIMTSVLAAQDVDQIIMPTKPAGSKLILEPLK
jgi:hypothetical protein